MKRFLFILMLACLSVASVDSKIWAGEDIIVGGYEFAPFVEFGADNQLGGVTIELIKAMNDFQNDYVFQFFPTSPSRRYRDFKNGLFDMIFFESISWGWRESGLPIEPSDEFLKGGEVYIALAREGRGQEYFDNFKDKKLVGIRGYHYGLAGFNSDPEYLKKEFNMTLVNGNAASIGMILKGRGETAIVTLSYLKQYLKQHPEDRSKLLVSDRFDQRYSHRILVRRGFHPGAAQMNELLSRMKEEGVLSRLWEKEGLTD